MEKIALWTKIGRVVLFLLVLTILRPMPGFSESKIADILHRHLRGLYGVHVLIEGFSPENKAAGFHYQTFQRDVELKLHLAGIDVLTEKESRSTPGEPYLHLIIIPSHDKQGQTARYSIDLYLMEKVRLVRNDSVIYVTTWEFGTFGHGSLAVVREKVKDLVDRFIYDWLNVNQKPAQQPSHSN